MYGLAATADSVYATGLFTQANGVARGNLAAFAHTNGALRSWAPTIDRQGDAMVIDPDGSHVIVGGRFYLTNGVVQRGLAPLDPVTGAIDTAWAASRTVVNGWSSGTTAGRAGIFALATDDSGVYGTGWVYANVEAGNLEGVFAAEAGTGAIRWVADCHGDHYGVYSTGETVYATSHTHQCDTVGLAPELSPRTYRYVEAFTATAEGTLTRSPSVSSIYKDWSGTPAPAPYAWYPDFTVGRTSGLNQAGLSMTGNGQFLSVAGEFGSVNNQRYEGIVRFATAPPNGPKQGPRIAAADVGRTHGVVGRRRSRAHLHPRQLGPRRPGPHLRAARTGRHRRRHPVAGRAVELVVAAADDLQRHRAHARLDATYTVRVRDGNGNAVTSRAATVTIASGQTSAVRQRRARRRRDALLPARLEPRRLGRLQHPAVRQRRERPRAGRRRRVTGESASSFNGTTNGRVSSGSSSSGPRRSRPSSGSTPRRPRAASSSASAARRRARRAATTATSTCRTTGG